MNTVMNFNSISTVTQSLEACSACQAGRCCGSCWCCYDRDRRATAPIMTTIVALRVVCGDVGCTWASSNGADNEVDLTETMGGSGWYGRPRKDYPMYHLVIDHQALKIEAPFAEAVEWRQVLQEQFPAATIEIADRTGQAIPACAFCEAPTPAAHLVDDWPLCADHANVMAAPWPEEILESEEV